MNRNTIFSILIILALIATTFNALWGVDFNQKMLRKLWGSESSIDNAELAVNLDAYFAYEFPAGNLFIHFDGLLPDRHHNFMQVQYIRAAYALHPRKVFVTQENVIVRHAQEILPHNAIPSSQWLAEHDVRNILIYYYQNGQQYSEIRRLPGRGD